MSEFNWFANHIHRPYAVRGEHFYFGGKRRTTHIRMHHHILPAPQGLVVDHINGNSLDNRRKNLRIATNQQNLTNKRFLSASKYIGVSPMRGKWRASVVSNGRQIYLGMFETEHEAAAAYDAGAKIHHGEFAKQNLGSAA